MNAKQEVVSNGHLQVVGERGNRRWRAFWWDADGKRSRVLGPAWVRGSNKRTACGATVWHAADGSKPDPSYLTPRRSCGDCSSTTPPDDRRRAPQPAPWSRSPTPPRLG